VGARARATGEGKFWGRKLLVGGLTQRHDLSLVSRPGALGPLGSDESERK
jgi:hypothetical protein